MEISSLHLFVTEIKEKSKSTSISIEEVASVLDIFLATLPVLDLKAIDLKSLKEIQEVLFLLEKEIPKESEILRAKWLSLSLGGRIPFEIFLKSDLTVLKFIQANRLEKKFLPLGIQLSFDEEKGIAIPIEIEPYVYQEVYWSDLKEVPVKKVGYRYYFQGILVFQTDKAYKLSSTFSPLLKGIAYYDPINSATVAPVDRRDPSEWSRKNYVEIWIWSRKEAGYTLLFKEEKGYIYSAGVVKGKISTPDLKYFEEPCLPNVQKYSIEVSYTDLRKMIEQISDDKFYRKTKRGKGHLIDVLNQKLHLSMGKRKWKIPFFSSGFSLKQLERDLRKDVRESKRD
jgi:hypothetical protein